MSDAAQPSFEDIFGEAFPSDGEVAPAGLASADLEEVLAIADDRHVGQVTAPGFGPRFDGDTSQLPPEDCWTLQELITAPHVREESRKYWSVLLQHEGILRSRLSELGLILEINREHGYAFTRQASDPSSYSRTLLRARTLTLAASALALYLYNQYLIAPEDPVVETSDMIDHLLSYKPPDDTDEARFTERTRKAIQSLADLHVIKPIPGTERYLIYGVITSLLSAERLAALDARYRTIASGTAVEDERMETSGDGVPEDNPDRAEALGVQADGEDTVD
ncbi:MAG TPA: DUF4194 domain-containing protein [Streptosporangiaceae bacterium]|jgi:hypothetical protein|nr:DUF4194 domain-containing protein [Streptosporangiaceae bacterium]